MEVAVAAGRGLAAGPTAGIRLPWSESSSLLACSSSNYSSRWSGNFSGTTGQVSLSRSQRTLDWNGFFGSRGLFLQQGRVERGASSDSGSSLGKNFGRSASCKLGSSSLERGVGAQILSVEGTGEVTGGLGRFSIAEHAGFSSSAKRRVHKITMHSSSGKSSGLEGKAEESKAATGEAVEGVKDESAKLKDAGGEKYEATAEKSDEVMKDTTEKLKQEAEKAKAQLVATAEEATAKGKAGLNTLVENAPDPVKGIAETAADAHLTEKRPGAKIHDFCLGIPYGGLLVVGGLLFFIISGNTSAILLGGVLGGLLLFLSVRSLNAWKVGKSSLTLIQGQATIAFIFLYQHAQKYLATKAIYPWGLLALVSGAMLAFYMYVYFSGGNPPKKIKAEPAPAA